MTESEFADHLAEALADYAENLGVDVRTRTFSDAGLLTRNNGIVATLGDGSTFQVTVVRSA